MKFKSMQNHNFMRVDAQKIVLKKNKRTSGVEYKNDDFFFRVCIIKPTDGMAYA